MNCNCPRSSYGIKHTSACYEAHIAQLEEQLREVGRTCIGEAGCKGYRHYTTLAQREVAK